MGAEVAPTIADVWAAAARIAPCVRRTSVVHSAQVNALCDAKAMLKCEHLQHTGAFKYRGATNAVQSLTDAQAARGVATYSSGNHGQALAMAARVRGVRCHVVMPHNSVTVKLDAVRAQGAIVHLCEPHHGSPRGGTGAGPDGHWRAAVHPFEARVIAGQETAVLELLTDHPDLGSRHDPGRRRRYVSTVLGQNDL